ncbi:extracellular solute-binding protein [Paenibacillus wynnii]|uniref:Sugar ABC transporter n=1 Tax=Paenibacillus wynnii TaxID=268407 RepID=A0A098M7X5_9BACL|nr:extracellular solute-binding protein [Paenibacillus wynnii]KGE18645.1 sugar ABC transporter [Paenibacillus wynnii]
MRLLLLITFILSFTAGCSSGSDGSAEANSTLDGKQDVAHYDLELGKFVPPVDLYTVGSVNPDINFKEGENLENNVHTRWTEERLGIRIRYLWTIPDSNEAYANKLRLELVKGNMPDIVTTRDHELIHELIDSGQFIDVGELFDQYASPVWKSAMDEEPSVWDSYIRDGEKYAIPILDYEYSADPILWIREDWLKRLNLPVPQTFIELEAVMDAFTNEDPDGNGVKDTYGLSLGFRNGPSTWMGDSSWIFGALGAVPEQWNMQADGQLQYGSTSPGTKQALDLLKNWVSKGFISPDCEWFDEERAASLFTDGKAGIIAGPYWMDGWPLSNVKNSYPDAVVQAVPIPAGPTGVVQRRGTLPVNGAILINKKMKHPEVFFIYQNYLFDYYATSNGEFTHGLAKEYDWTEIKGSPTVEPEYLPQGGLRVASYTLTFDGARIPSKVFKAIPNSIIPVLFSQKESSKKEQFTGPPTKTMRTSWELLRKLEQKTFQKIIFSDMKVESFDSFVQKWSQYGGEQITQEVNNWYLSQNSQK